MGGIFCAPLAKRRGVGSMVTYAELFQYSLVILGLVALFIQATKKK